MNLANYNGKTKNTLGTQKKPECEDNAHNLVFRRTRGYRPGRKRDPEELDDFHVSPPPSSGMIHHEEQEIEQRRQERCLDEQ